MFGLTQKEVAIINTTAAQHHAPPRVMPPSSKKMELRTPDAKGDAYLAEYAELASATGVMPPDLSIEAFKAFLVKRDLPMFALGEVIAYMDEKAARESKDQSGWEWRPLREKDNLLDMEFGRAPEWKRDDYGRSSAIINPASDYYRGKVTQLRRDDRTGHEMRVERDALQRIYDKTIPLHALRRIALIEREHDAPVHFFVSDYALAPAIANPDPFLMAVVPNTKVGRGDGRFVIDFWDEPGFGIERMLK